MPWVSGPEINPRARNGRQSVLLTHADEGLDQSLAPLQGAHGSEGTRSQGLRPCGVGPGLCSSGPLGREISDSRLIDIALVAFFGFHASDKFGGFLGGVVTA
jgi:hypothetical protein